MKLCCQVGRRLGITEEEDAADSGISSHLDSAHVEVENRCNDDLSGKTFDRPTAQNREVRAGGR